LVSTLEADFGETELMGEEGVDRLHRSCPKPTPIPYNLIGIHGQISVFCENSAKICADGVAGIWDACKRTYLELEIPWVIDHPAQKRTFFSLEKTARQEMYSSTVVV
jgi:hypothetical protein